MKDKQLKVSSLLKTIINGFNQTLPGSYFHFKKFKEIRIDKLSNFFQMKFGFDERSVTFKTTLFVFNLQNQPIVVLKLPENYFSFINRIFSGRSSWETHYIDD